MSGLRLRTLQESIPLIRKTFFLMEAKTVFSLSIVLNKANEATDSYEHYILL